MGGQGDTAGYALLGLVNLILIIVGGSFLFVGFILFVIAGGVNFSSPFSILSTIPLIIGVIGIVLAIIIVYYSCYHYSLDSHSYYRVCFLILRFLFGIIALISFPVGIISAVGFFSLDTSVDVLFTKPYVNLNPGESSLDWIGQTKKKMNSTGVLLTIGFVFVIIPVICFLVPSCSEEHLPKEKRSDALTFAVVQLLCGLLLFLPLRLLGRVGLAPFGFAGLKGSTYTGVCVLGIVVVALAEVNIVLVGVSLILKIITVSRIMGAIGCVVSIAIVVYASIVLAERAKAELNLRAFCAAEEGASPHTHTHCDELLARFKANMCVGEGDGDRAEGEGEEDKEGGIEPCEDQYTMKVLQEEMLAQTRGWMGFMGFACMFLAFVHVGIALLLSLRKPPENLVWDAAGCFEKERQRRGDERERERQERRR